MGVYIGRVAERRKLSPGISQTTLDLAGTGFSFTAGQYVSVTLPGLENAEITDQFHDFSIASSSSNPEKISIIYRESGSVYKNHLLQLPIGAEIEVEGPGGIFTIDTTAKHQLWIAGGIGITPFLSMVRSPIPKDLHIDTFHFAHAKSDLFYADDFEQAAVNLYVKIGSAHLPQLQLDKPYDKVMLAGPPGMVTSAKRILRLRGVDDARIQTEEFSGYDT